MDERSNAPDLMEDVGVPTGATPDPGATYCRITPRFEAPDGPHEWLTRTIFVGAAERRGASTFFDYYAVT